MALEHMVTAMSYLLSTCVNGNNTIFMENSVLTRPLDDLWGVGCRNKAVEFNEKLTNLLKQQEQTRIIIDKIERSIKKLQSKKDYKPNNKRNKREVADDNITYPRFDCNGSITDIRKTEINAEMPSFLVSCGSDSYGHGWVLIATLNATHRMRLKEKHRIELISGFGDFVYGNAMSEYFIGLERLHSITTSDAANEVHQLLILTHDVKERNQKEATSSKHFMQYNSFAIAEASNDYRLLSLKGYQGDIADPLMALLGQPFSIPQIALDDAHHMTMFVRSVLI